MEKGDTGTSAVAEHVWLQGHKMDFKNSTILAQEADRHQRCYVWNLGLFSAVFYIDSLVLYLYF